MTYGQIRQEQRRANAVMTLIGCGLAALFIAACMVLFLGGCTTTVVRTPVCDVAVDLRFHLPEFVRDAMTEAEDVTADEPVPAIVDMGGSVER